MWPAARTTRSSRIKECRMRRFLPVVAALVLLLAADGTAFAQTRARMIGTVRDVSGAILPGATVSLSSPVLVGGDQTDVSDADGVYRFVELLPGVYTLSATLQGFKKVQRQDIRIEFGTTVTIDFTLTVANGAETITVHGSQ